jgi:hypothetical protein
MQQELSRWIPLIVAIVAGSAILLRHAYGTKERRSPGQWVIFQMYRVIRIGWALIRGIDVGYLEYRRVLEQAAIQVENERQLGKLAKRGEGTAALLAAYAEQEG